uniref:C-type lectin domain-containing protein n=1 Tax=Magallana gigas TaxID=29159 RepID=K1S449_MAGGI
MPVQSYNGNCVTGCDEWFPEYQTCIWIPTHGSLYEEAKRLCESAGKIMLGLNNFLQVLNLIDLLNTQYIHVYSRRTGNKTYEMDDRTLIPSTFWCPGQPRKDSDCLGVQNDPQSSWCTSPGVDDIICSHTRQFFCV